MEQGFTNGAKPDDIIYPTFVIWQNGKVVRKEVKMYRQTFLDYNKMPKDKWAEMYQRIVDDKAYISITDLTGSN